jgi:hypothetical protein
MTPTMILTAISNPTENLDLTQIWKNPKDEPSPDDETNYDSKTKGHNENNSIHETNKDIK